MTAPLHTRIVDRMADIPPRDWNRLGGTEYPFLRHEFLNGLEASGCATQATGWIPCHIVAFDAQARLCGALPLYRKMDSWGEFVFDWGWADAYRRAGLSYYPKLVSTVPFTPATAPCFLVAPDQQADVVRSSLMDAAMEQARAQGMSSLHLLFIPPAETGYLASRGLLLRKDCQFHWHNRGYHDFDHFLAHFTSARRNKVRRERRRVAEAGIRFVHLDGDQLDAAGWRGIMPLYADSFHRRGREPYLNEQFFIDISAALPGQVLVILALLRDEPVAVAICFRSADTLYGRYWGSSGRYHSLHFETCYYQGIDYCISHGLRSFEPGTQGEHKISRGFVPTETWSAHWLAHAEFSAAIEQYLQQERHHMDRYMEQAGRHVPYRKSPEPDR